MIPATPKRLRSVFLTLSLLAVLGLALLCQPLLMVETTDVSNATNVSAVIGPITTLLKCFVGSCDIESQNP